MLVSSDSTESTTVDMSSAKADWIMMMAFNWSMSPRHHPLLLSVSKMIESESVVVVAEVEAAAVVVFSSIFVLLAPVRCDPGNLNRNVKSRKGKFCLREKSCCWAGPKRGRYGLGFDKGPDLVASCNSALTSGIES